MWAFPPIASIATIHHSSTRLSRRLGHCRSGQLFYLSQQCWKVGLVFTLWLSLSNILTDPKQRFLFPLLAHAVQFHFDAILVNMQIAELCRIYIKKYKLAFSSQYWCFSRGNVWSKNIFHKINLLKFSDNKNTNRNNLHRVRIYQFSRIKSFLATSIDGNMLYTWNFI